MAVYCIVSVRFEAGSIRKIKFGRIEPETLDWETEPVEAPVADAIALIQDGNSIFTLCNIHGKFFLGPKWRVSFLESGELSIAPVGSAIESSHLAEIPIF